jgi:integrase
VASYFQRKDSPFYWLRFKKLDGSWGQKSSGVKLDAAGAIRRIHQVVAEETSKESAQTQDGVSAMFRQWVPGWIDYHYRNTWSRIRCLNAWSHWSVFLGEKRVVHPAEMTYALAHEYMRWRTNPLDNCGRKKSAWNTAVMEVRFMGAVMQESLRRGWVVANPFARLGLAKRKAKEKRAITRKEEERIFEALRTKRLGKWMEESFLVAIRQGCRLKEVAVPLEQIDVITMVIVFNVKGGKQHAAPLHKDLLPLVAKAKAEKRGVLVNLPQQPSPRWGEFFKSIGMDDLCFHCTRVTVVTRLCEAGFSESQTMAYVGHASEAVHAIYRKIRPTALASLGDVL